MSADNEKRTIIGLESMLCADLGCHFIAAIYLPRLSRDAGDEVVCPVCADKAKDVKAARVEALEKSCVAGCGQCAIDFNDVILIDRGTWEHKTKIGPIIHCWSTKIRDLLIEATK